MSGEEAEAKGVSEFCCRAVLVPETPTSAILWLAVVPLSLAALKEKLPNDYNRNSCPQIALVVGAGGVRPTRVNMELEERERDGCGFGCFPLLEWLTSELAHRFRLSAFARKSAMLHVIVAWYAIGTDVAH